MIDRRARAAGRVARNRRTTHLNIKYYNNTIDDMRWVNGERISHAGTNLTVSQHLLICRALYYCIK
jgi:hypothetical protein